MMGIKKALTGTVLAVLLVLGGTAVTAVPVSATVYGGTIDCGGLEVEGMWINQSGNSGWASWSYAGFARANWSYNFNGNPYTVAIGCGGSTSAWATTNTSPAAVYPAPSQNWVCNTFQRYCVLG